MKEYPGKPTVGIGGAGGGGDVVGTYFQKNTGTRLQFVPYRGAAPIMQEADNQSSRDKSRIINRTRNRGAVVT